MLTKDQILTTAARVKKVDVPEWGGHLYVKGMSGAERDAWEAWVFGQPDSDKYCKGARIRLCLLTICNEKGELLFSEEDEERLNQVDGGILERVANEAQKFNALTGEAQDDQEKN